MPVALGKADASWIGLAKAYGCLVFVPFISLMPLLSEFRLSDVTMTFDRILQ